VSHGPGPSPRPRGLGRWPGRPLLTIEQILAWADAHRAATGSWPKVSSGKVVGSESESWCAINNALSKGQRGLPSGGSLARLLAERRGAPQRPAAGWQLPAAHRRRHWKREPRPPLTEQEILAWADEHHRLTGRWPRISSPPKGLPIGETWTAIQSAMTQGLRGLPGGSSLATLLQEHRGVRNKQGLHRLTIEQVLAWADAYRAAHGRWPRDDSGPVAESPTPGDTWAAIDDALTRGLRGLPVVGSSLPQLLAEHRGVRTPLTFERILEWADAHREATGRWPSATSGAVIGQERETWHRIDANLMRGQRGLPSGWTLARLLAEFRGRPRGGSSSSFRSPHRTRRR
jgi:hypothetical protein